MLVDTHCHLDFPEFDRDRDACIKRAKDEGVSLIVNIGSSLEGSRRSVELARQYDCVYASVGIHPHEADNYESGVIRELKTLASENKVVAIGEIGLDYFKNYSKHENQERMFNELLNLAKELDLPVVLHSRAAGDDIFKAIKNFMPLKGVMHCFSGDEAYLKACLDLGMFVSFTCNITYKKAENLRELVKVVPLERLFLETDAPFLPPEDFRGRRNEPSYVRVAANLVSGLKGIAFEKVCEQTTLNAKCFFNIK